MHFFPNSLLASKFIPSLFTFDPKESKSDGNLKFGMDTIFKFPTPEITRRKVIASCALIPDWGIISEVRDILPTAPVYSDGEGGNSDTLTDTGADSKSWGTSTDIMPLLTFNSDWNPNFPILKAPDFVGVIRNRSNGATTYLCPFTTTTRESLSGFVFLYSETQFVNLGI